MATCSWCEQSGWFLSVDKSRLCKKCAPIVALDIRNRSKIIRDSLTISRSSPNVDTRLSRLDVLMTQAEHLAAYERKGVPFAEFSPAKLLLEARESRGKLIVSALREPLEEMRRKAQLPGVSAKPLINQLGKLLLKAQDFLAQHPEIGEIAVIEGEIRDQMHQIQLGMFLEDAKKSEFKGNVRKAISSYHDVLYFLKNDHIDDADQAGLIAEVEAKIALLGAEKLKSSK